VGVVTMKAILR